MHLGDPEAVPSEALTCLNEESEELCMLDIGNFHNHNPCIIHRDLNCNNIFVNGNTCVLKIMDLGFTIIVANDHVAHSIIGTLECMTP